MYHSAGDAGFALPESAWCCPGSRQKQEEDHAVPLCWFSLGVSAQIEQLNTGKRCLYSIPVAAALP